jgi:hypothetical protein
MNKTLNPIQDKIVNVNAEIVAAVAADVQMLAEQAEYDAIVKAGKALTAAYLETGSNVLARLARECGQSVSKSGRPSYEMHRRFVGALLERQTKYAEQDRLFRLAQKSVSIVGLTPDELEKAKSRFVSAKGRAAEGKATCTLKMASPANVAIALGE